MDFVPEESAVNTEVIEVCSVLRAVKKSRGPVKKCRGPKFGATREYRALSHGVCRQNAVPSDFLASCATKMRGCVPQQLEREEFLSQKVDVMNFFLEGWGGGGPRRVSSFWTTSWLRSCGWM